jgi:hypothetical protein
MLEEQAGKSSLQSWKLFQQNPLHVVISKTFLHEALNPESDILSQSSPKPMKIFEAIDCRKMASRPRTAASAEGALDQVRMVEC